MPIPKAATEFYANGAKKMIIPFNDRYRINSDKHAWFIQEKGRNRDPETKEWVDKWTGIKWYPTFDKCLAGARQLAIRTSSAETCPDALRDIDAAIRASEVTMMEYKELLKNEA